MKLDKYPELNPRILVGCDLTQPVKFMAKGTIQASVNDNWKVTANGVEAVKG
ncbi:hypothetical protein [Cohnella sp. AR92]|uniref:hypothetical protein n=1 Tax=Cohnella sp. AR92 TaxID=648716 RepID=UPI001315367D|nr:hypothetical protein [Cohnella sp. AR92]